MARVGLNVIDRLSMHAWFPVLASEHQMLVQRTIVIQHFVTGAFVARRGAASHYWIGVHSGLIKLAIYSMDGRSCTLSGVPAGGWIGEGSVIKREARKYDVIAVRDAEIMLLPEQTFHTLLAESLPFTAFVIRQLNERMGEFIASLQNTRLLSTDAQVAQAIAQLFHPVLYPRTMAVLAFSQEEIGLLTGLSRQRVNQALQQLAKLNLVTTSYQSIQVVDLDGLRRFGLAQL